MAAVSSFQRHAQVKRQLLGNLALERLRFEVGRHVADLEHELGQRRRILAEHGRHAALDPLAQRRVEPPHHAHVQQPDTPFGLRRRGRDEQDVPRVRIGVEEAVAEDHRQEDPRTPAGQVVGVATRRLHLVQMRERDAVEVLQHRDGRA